MAEFMVLTPQLESLYKELKRRIHRLQSGGTVDSIINVGADPGNQIGASFQALKSLALRYDKNNSLAKLLWADRKREEQIVALFLFDEQITQKQMLALLEHCVNYEVAEYAGSQWLVNRDNVNAILQDSLECENVMVQVALIATSARLLMLHERGLKSADSIAKQYILRSYGDDYLEFMAERYRFKYV